MSCLCTTYGHLAIRSCKLRFAPQPLMIGLFWPFSGGLCCFRWEVDCACQHVSAMFLDIQFNYQQSKCSFTGMLSGNLSFHVNSCLLRYFKEICVPYTTPSAYKDIWDSWMVYMVLIIIFMDDASANISKQWNKHIVVYLSNMGLPHEMLNKEFCMKFIMSSPNAPPMELMWAVWDSMEYVWIFILSIHQVSLYLRKALDLPVVTFNYKWERRYW